MESNHRCLVVGQKSLPLDHGIEVDSPGIAPGSSVCRTDVFLLDHEPIGIAASGSRGIRTHKRGSLAACFQDRFLNQSDDFRSQVAGAGIEPAPPGSEPSVTASSNYPAVMCLRDCVPSIEVRELRGQESNLRTRGSKPRISTSRNYPAIKGTGGTRTHARVLNRHLLCR
jgi:hypothetical protein